MSPVGNLGDLQAGSKAAIVISDCPLSTGRGMVVAQLAIVHRESHTHHLERA